MTPKSAAHEAASRFLTAMAEKGLTTAELARAASTPAARAVWRRLADGVRDGRITPCEHLTRKPPARVFWVAEVDPDRLLCERCTAGLVTRLDVSQLTRACTACGSHADRLHQLTLVIGPVTIAASICPTCHLISSSSAGTPPGSSTPGGLDAPEPGRDGPGSDIHSPAKDRGPRHDTTAHPG